MAWESSFPSPAVTHHATRTRTSFAAVEEEEGQLISASEGASLRLRMPRVVQNGCSLKLAGVSERTRTQRERVRERERLWCLKKKKTSWRILIVLMIPD